MGIKSFQVVRKKGKHNLYSAKHSSTCTNCCHYEEYSGQ